MVDAAEQGFLENVILADPAYADQSLWIGLTDLDEEGIFVWTSGVPLGYSNWLEGEPHGADGDEDYVVVTFSAGEPSQTGVWSDEVRRTARHGIIELGAEPEASLLDQIFGAHDNTVAGNFIGTDVTGMSALPNTQNGISVGGGSQRNAIGSDGDGVSDEMEGNVVSGNGQHGVYLWGGAAHNVIAGNFIGTNSTGMGAVPNERRGVVISGGSQFNRIGTNGDGVEINSTGFSTFYWDPAVGGNGHYYVVCPATTWRSAVNVAESSGGHLASINSPAEQAFVASVILSESNYWNCPLWIGLTDEGSQGKYEWTTGEILEYTNWAPNEPTDLLYEDYVAVNVYWDDPALRTTWSDEVNWEWYRGLIELTEESDVLALEALFGADDNQLEGNEIAFNGGDGLHLSSDISGNRIKGNAVFENGGLGINLVGGGETGDGVTQNDIGDTDCGPNSLQNFPVISAAATSTATWLHGTLHSLPDSLYTLDFYASAHLDASGFGEGQRWLGAIAVATDGSGASDFDVNLTSLAAPGEWLTATATDAAGNTSEFSLAVEVDAIIDLGTVDSFNVSDQLLSADGLWYRVEATRDGILTVLATAEAPFQLALHGENWSGPPANNFAASDHEQRLDEPVVSGAVYHVKVFGEPGNVDLTFANLVNREGTNVTVSGTPVADTFEFASTGSFQVTINGIVYHYEDSEFSAVHFDGGDGQDVVVLDDSPGDECLEAWPDRATLMNGAGDGQSDYTVIAENLEVLLSYARNGGSDTAVLHGSEGSDKFKSYENYGLLRAKSAAYWLRAKLFDSVVADSGGSGEDAAVFNGTDGQEIFAHDGGENSARIQSNGRDHTARGFKSILAHAAGGSDNVAYFTDISGPDGRLDDVFYFRAHKTQLVGQEVKVTARLFDEVHATAGQSGIDVARIYDTTGDDHLQIGGSVARLYHRTGERMDLLYEALGFEIVKAYATEGNDTISVGDTDMVLLLYGWEE